MNWQGTLIEEKTAEIYDIFNPVEGFNAVYYGKIRNGKTYSATSDILDLLEQGEIVYANWEIDFKGFDERQSFFRVLLKTVFGKPYFYNFKAENFHYLDQNSPTFITDINKLVGVHLFIDEGQWIFNSHLKTDDVEKRRLVLEGGHYCRSLNVITQRPTNILKDVRSQVHIWYKCEKVLHIGKLLRFVRWSIEDMKDDLPIDPADMEKKPPSKAYWANKRVYNAYNTHGRRSKDAIELLPEFDVYRYTLLDKLNLLLYMLIPTRYKGRGTLKRPRPKPIKTVDETKNPPKYNLRDLKDTA